MCWTYTSPRARPNTATCGCATIRAAGITPDTPYRRCATSQTCTRLRSHTGGSSMIATRPGLYREVLVFSGDEPTYQDLSNHHRGQDHRKGHKRQMFAVHDPEAGISYRAGFSTT